VDKRWGKGGSLNGDIKLFMAKKFFSKINGVSDGQGGSIMENSLTKCKLK